MPTPSDPRRTGAVSADEAREIAHRFINGHFQNPAEGPRISIPADLRRDDDLRLLAFVNQARRAFAVVDATRPLLRLGLLCPPGCQCEAAQACERVVAALAALDEVRGG